MKHFRTTTLALGLAAFASTASAATMPVFSANGFANVDPFGVSFFDDLSGDVAITAVADIDVDGSFIAGEFSVEENASPFNTLLFTQTATSIVLNLVDGAEDTLEILVEDVSGTRADEFTDGARIVFSFFEEEIDEFGDVAASVKVFGAGDLTPIPLPASALLLIGGLGALGAMRRRRSFAPAAPRGATLGL